MVTMEESQSCNLYFNQTYKLTFNKIKGLFSGRWYFKLFNFIIALGGLAMAAMGKYFYYARYLSCPEIRDLGMWGAGELIRVTFEMSGSATSFGCDSPV